MLLGLDVTDRFPDFHLALKNCTYSSVIVRTDVLNPWLAAMSLAMQQHALSMLSPSKKNISPHSLLASMAGFALGNGVQRSPAVAINGVSPLPPPYNGID
jgi:eukaryotic translation initiation factor 2-alpha kinase 4